MKRLIILLIVTIPSILICRAQSNIQIDINDLQSRINRELPELTMDLSDIPINWDSMNHSINKDLAIALENLHNNKGNIYAYTYNPSEFFNNDYNYSYTTTETTQTSDVFNQLSKIKGVEVVYISKTMLGMMSNMNMPGVDIRNITNKLESLEIYSAEQKSASKQLSNISKNLLKGNNYETLMLIKDNDSQTAFYVKKNKSNQRSEMLMVTEDGAETTIIRFLGSFTIQDLKNITKQNKNIRINSYKNGSYKTNDSELEKRIKDAQERADERIKRAEERAREAEERAEKRAREAEQRAKEAEERARKRN